MDNAYRFVGRHSIVGDRDFNHFGQQADFSEDEFLEISEKSAFIPRAEFDALEIPADDIARFGSTHYSGAKPQAFLDAVESARDKYRAMRDALHG
jgi:hypothetical protein